MNNKGLNFWIRKNESIYSRQMNKENIFFRNIILNKLYSNDNISLRYGHGKFIDLDGMKFIKTYLCNYKEKLCKKCKIFNGFNALFDKSTIKYLIKVHYNDTLSNRYLLISKNHFVMLSENMKIIIDIYPFRINGVSFKDYFNSKSSNRLKEQLEYQKDRDKEKVIPNIGTYKISDKIIEQFKNYSKKKKVVKSRNVKVERIKQNKNNKTKFKMRTVLSNLSRK